MSAGRIRESGLSDHRLLRSAIERRRDYQDAKRKQLFHCDLLLIRNLSRMSVVPAGAEEQSNCGRREALQFSAGVARRARSDPVFSETSESRSVRESCIVGGFVTAGGVAQRNPRSTSESSRLSGFALSDRSPAVFLTQARVLLGLCAAYVLRTESKHDIPCRESDWLLGWYHDQPAAPRLDDASRQAGRQPHGQSSLPGLLSGVEPGWTGACRGHHIRRSGPGPCVADVSGLPVQRSRGVAHNPVRFVASSGYAGLATPRLSGTTNTRDSDLRGDHHPAMARCLCTGGLPDHPHS